MLATHNSNDREICLSTAEQFRPVADYFGPKGTRTWIISKVSGITAGTKTTAP